MSASAVALIPARAGSTRVPDKNLRPLGGLPLIAHTIASARASGIFTDIVVSTDSEQIAEIAREHGAEVPALRPARMATATSADIEWVEHMLELLESSGRTYDVFGLLRPTSPFRSPDTVRAAFERLVAYGDEADSIRAVRVVREHPGKMWIVEGEWMHPLFEPTTDDVPAHSRQFHDLPEVHVQDSSLELAWTRVPRTGGGIAGTRVLAWVSRGDEGFSIDYPEDFDQAEAILARRR